MVASLPSPWDVTKATTGASPGTSRVPMGSPPPSPQPIQCLVQQCWGGQTKTEHVR